jgi:DNA-binding SARP family transcriptional activator/Tfp pilus assembly protein PilF
MDLTILGPTRLVVQGRSVELATRQRALLALLACRLGQSVPVSLIIDLVWGETAPPGVQQRLYETASRLRKVLRSHGVPGTLDREPGSYRLTLEPDLIDMNRLRRYTAQARAALSRRDEKSATALLIAAAELWRGEPLAELRGSRADDLRRQLVDTALNTLLLLFDLQRRYGQHAAIITRLAPLIEAHRDNEALARHWMLALAATGRDQEARTFFASLRQYLRRELDTEPSADLLEIYRRLPSPRGAGQRTAVPAQRRSVPRRPFPRDIDDFTGRSSLLARLDALVEQGASAPTGAVVLDGAPGVGKTALAVRFGHRQQTAFPDGQILLDLGAHGPNRRLPAADVLGSLLDMLGMAADRIPADLARRQDRLAEVLVDRRMLIVLDNVSEEAQVRPVLTAASTCFLIVTSRARLPGLVIRHGVHGITVSPLDEAESRALLGNTIGTDRAEREPDQVAALAAQSGGLPIALRVIAQHAAERPLARIADIQEQLRVNRKLLTYGRDSGGEDTSLLTLFQHYSATLPADAGRLFRLLGLHPSSRISVAAAAALRGGTVDDTERLLDTLARMHFIEHGTTRRYWINDVSWGCARQCAEDAEPPDQRSAARRRLLDWYLLSAARAAAILAPHRDPVPGLPDGSGVQPARFGTETEAMSWCIDERLTLAAMTRLALEYGFHRHGWQLPAAVHETYERFGCQDDVLDCQRIALACAQQLNDPEAILGTRNNTGTTCLALRQYDRAAVEFEHVLRLAQELGHRDDEARGIHNLAIVQLRKGEIRASVNLFKQALHICREIGDPAGEAHATHRLGIAHRWMGKYDQAFLYAEAALAIRQRCGFMRGQGLSHAELAELHLATGQCLLALRHSERALTIHAQTRDELKMSAALVTAARVQLALGLLDEALEHARRAVDISVGAQDSHTLARATATLGDILAASGSIELAHASWRHALTILDELKDPEADNLRHRLVALPEAAETFD